MKDLEKDTAEAKNYSAILIEKFVNSLPFIFVISLATLTGITLFTTLSKWLTGSVPWL
jgi:hypothetical protein